MFYVKHLTRYAKEKPMRITGTVEVVEKAKQKVEHILHSTSRTKDIFLDPEVKVQYQSRCLSYWTEAFEKNKSEEFDEMR